MNGKKILAIAILVNLVFIGAYMYLNPNTVAAQSEGKAVAKQNKPKASTEEQWKLIRQREEQLKVRESELKALEVQIEKKIEKLRTVESTVKTEIDSYRQLSNNRIRHLVKIYSSMKSKNAAGLMDALDLEVAVEVLLNMKGDIAGGILSYMNPKKAAIITKKLANYRNKNKGT